MQFIFLFKILKKIVVKLLTNQKNGYIVYNTKIIMVYLYVCVVYMYKGKNEGALLCGVKTAKEKHRQNKIFDALEK